MKLHLLTRFLSTKIGIQRILFSILFLMLINACSHQIFVITIPKSSNSKYDAAQVEPAIAVNPRNARELIAGTVLNDFYYSKNQGKTWVSSTLNSPYSVHGDPVVLIDYIGNYYYFHLSNPKQGHFLDRIVCQRTTNLTEPMQTVGHTPTNGKMHDKHWATIDPKSGTIHMAWTQFDKYDSKEPSDSTIIVYSQSSDKGVTWSLPVRVSKRSGNCLDNSGTIEGVSICLGLNDEIFIAYCLNEKIYFNVSSDNGKSWLSRGELEIADQIGGWDFKVPGVYRVNGFPSLQMDHSASKYRGRLYLSWSDQRNGADDTDVWLKFSDDQGKTWSEAVRMNDDGTGKQQYLSTMRVDPVQGTVVALFYDRRNHKDWTTDVYLAISRDGGQSFENFKINKTSFVPNPKLFFGDYLALDVLDNYIHAMWPELHNDKIELKYARVRISSRQKNLMP